MRRQLLTLLKNITGDVSYLESVNKETLKNGIGRLKDLGVIHVFVGSQPPPETFPGEPLGSNSKAGSSGVSTWIAVKTDWLPPLDAFPEIPRASGGIEHRGRTSSNGSSLRRLFPEAPLQLQYSVTETLLHGLYRPLEPDLSLPSPSSTSTSTGRSPTKAIDESASTAAADSAFSQWSTFEPSGYLWMLCERIGAFRREGKNRRDTATVANRVLRLATIAGTLWSDAMIKSRSSEEVTPVTIIGQARL